VIVADRIDKTHLTYAKSAPAGVMPAATVGLADVANLPISATHVLSSGVAGTVWANRSGIQGDTIKKIGVARMLPIPAAILLSAAFFTLDGFVVPGREPTNERPSPTVGGAADPESAVRADLR
jgi:PiT family inorganic phosphate transporter